MEVKGSRGEFDARAITRPDRSLPRYYVLCAVLTGPIVPIIDSSTVTASVTSATAQSYGLTPVECPSLDDDADGWSNLEDDCPQIYDPPQTDLDLDGAGDVCDCARQDESAFLLPSEIHGVDVSGKSTTTLSWPAQQAGAARPTT